MSMTTVNAKTYVAQVIGGAASPQVIDAAGQAILRGYQDWQSARFWRFLLKDTSNGFRVSHILTATTSQTAPSTGAFDGVNVGLTVTDTAGKITVATKVSSITYNTDGTVATIVLDNAPGAGATTLIFSADIPIVTGTRSYNLPTDFNSAFGARLTSNTKRPLTWRDIRHWDRTIIDQSVQGTPCEYTTYNPHSDLTQNYGATRLMLDRIPSADDVLQLRYYRSFITTGTYIDMPDGLLYKFLDYCRSLLLNAKLAQDNPAGYTDLVTDSFEKAQEGDEEPTDDNDADMCMKSQYEMGMNNRPLWGNGDFDPTR